MAEVVERSRFDELRITAVEEDRLDHLVDEVLDLELGVRAGPGGQPVDQVDREPEVVLHHEQMSPSRLRGVGDGDQPRHRAVLPDGLAHPVHQAALDRAAVFGQHGDHVGSELRGAGPGDVAVDPADDPVTVARDLVEERQLPRGRGDDDGEPLGAVGLVEGRIDGPVDHAALLRRRLLVDGPVTVGGVPLAWGLDVEGERRPLRVDERGAVGQVEERVGAVEDEDPRPRGPGEAGEELPCGEGAVDHDLLLDGEGQAQDRAGRGRHEQGEAPGALLPCVDAALGLLEPCGDRVRGIGTPPGHDLLDGPCGERLELQAGLGVCRHGLGDREEHRHRGLAPLPSQVEHLVPRDALRRRSSVPRHGPVPPAIDLRPGCSRPSPARDREEGPDST